MAHEFYIILHGYPKISPEDENAFRASTCPQELLHSTLPSLLLTAAKLHLEIIEGAKQAATPAKSQDSELLEPVS
jgi:hypothetical protein